MGRFNLGLRKDRPAPGFLLWRSLRLSPAGIFDLFKGWVKVQIIVDLLIRPANLVEKSNILSLIACIVERYQRKKGWMF